jgi:hypothetical protein
MRSFVLFTKYYKDVKIKGDEMGGHVARIRDPKSSWEILVGKPERNMALASAKFKWVDGSRRRCRVSKFTNNDKNSSIKRILIK